MAQAMFGHPLVADRAQILGAAPSLPGACEGDDGDDRGKTADDPDDVHRRSHDLQRGGAVCVRFRFHISPHAMQRQYVDSLIFSLAALMVVAPQKGHDVGAAAVAGISGRRGFKDPLYTIQC